MNSGCLRHGFTIALFVLSWACGCATPPSSRVEGALLSSPTPPLDDGGAGGFGRNSAEARITHLISEGQFAEAEALIAESTSSGLIDHSVAAALRKTVAEQSMKLGEIPASLQRVGNFPAQLKDFSRHQIQLMLKQKDFSLATKKELQTALKLLKEHKRIMQKN